MDILFTSPFTYILYVIAIVCFTKLPRRIEAMYFKENILTESRRIAGLVDYIVISLWIGSSISYVIYYGFEKIYTYIFIGIFVLFAMLIIYSQIMIKYRNSKRKFLKIVYFAEEGIVNEILSINEKYSNVKLQISAAGSVMSIIIESENKEPFTDILDKLQNEKILFQDLSDNKFRKKLIIESLFFLLAVAYLVSFLIYLMV